VVNQQVEEKNINVVEEWRRTKRKKRTAEEKMR